MKMRKSPEKIFFILFLGMIALLLVSCSRSGEEDGEYVPSFGYTGGTGRVEISCPSVTVKDGEATAQLEFDSTHYTYVRIGEDYYYNENEGGNSSFSVPVTLNGETEIAAETTAMSEPHEVEYTLYVYTNGKDVSEIRPGNEDAAAEETADSGEAENGDGWGEFVSVQQASADGPADVSAYNSDNPDPAAPVIDGLTYESTQALDYAECFAIYRYQDGYSVIRVNDGRDYFLIPEGGSQPDDLPSDCTVIQKPVKNIYLAATASMSLFDALDALDTIRLSSVQADGWYIDNAKKAMEKGDIVFAGKYSEPDYELILGEGCQLAIESTMILHSPDIQEKLEELGINVLIDRSSYEIHPLGRTEWIKVYGELTDKQEEADAYFAEQESYVSALEDEENTGKTVAFFYINESGSVVTRKSSDYVAKMIQLAGGKYIFENLGDADNTASSNIDMTMEEFYASGKDADYLVYNGTIDNPLTSVDDLIAKDQLFADFKAVKEGNVWCTGKYLYQATSVIGSMTADFHTMLTDDSAEELTFMNRLK